MPPDNLDAREAFEGRDVVWGQEMCSRLLSEGLGIGVYSRDTSKMRRDSLSDRRIGEEDSVQRTVTSYNDNLLGVVIPNDHDKKELVFISSHAEQGFVFRLDETRDFVMMTNYNEKLVYPGYGSFSQYIDHLAYGFGANGKVKYVLKEDDNNLKYQEIVESAVEQARKRQIEIRKVRGESRKNLFTKLFGSG